MSTSLLKMSYATTCLYAPPVPAPVVLRDFQRAGVEYLRAVGRGVLADPMGLGKTPQAIAFMNSVAVKRYLVIAPASLLQNWKNEIKRFSTLDAPPHIFTPSAKNPSDAILILSFGLCSDPEILQRILRGYQFDGLIVDEAHYLKNPDARRTRNILGVNGPFDRAKYVACLSGTPMVNKPVEIWPVANRLQPGALGCTNFREFCQHFANERLNPFTNRVEYVGSKNEHELGRRLRSTMMVRREKGSVLKDLPAKTRRAIYLDRTPATDRLVLAERLLYDDFLKNEKIAPDRVDSTKRVRAQLALIKSKQVVEYCRLVLETEHKILVFGWHRSLLTDCCAMLAGYGVRVVTGATDPSERQQRVDEFQNDPNVRVFVGAIPAAGVGLTLTAASHVIMAESSWVPGENMQAEDRAHRISQRNAVVVDYLVFPNSVDEHVLKTVGTKAAQLDMVLNADFSASQS